jgi:tRNA pseudouridine38-40 synthase
VRPSGRNLKLEIEYDGTNYCGWQVQRSHHVTKSQSHQLKSIQEIIEKILQKILQEKIRLIASGRTDAGVHALAQVANFKTHSDIAPEKLQKALNGLLPDDISISKIQEVVQDFHSRFRAKSKIYRYTILNRVHPSALLRNMVYFYPYPLDVNLMRKEARCLIGKHDFKAFCASGSDAKDTARTIKRITIKKLTYHLSPITYRLREPSLIVIEIEADGFLYNMVRNIVGTLIEIGRGRFPEGCLKRILQSRNRKLAGPIVPAKGLCLLEVKYSSEH